VKTDIDNLTAAMIRDVRNAQVITSKSQVPQ